MSRFPEAYLSIKLINLNLPHADFDHPYEKTTHTTKPETRWLTQKKKKLLTCRTSEVPKFQEKENQKRGYLWTIISLPTSWSQSPEKLVMLRKPDSLHHGVAVWGSLFCQVLRRGWYGGHSNKNSVMVPGITVLCSSMSFPERGCVCCTLPLQFTELRFENKVSHCLSFFPFLR